MSKIRHDGRRIFGQNVVVNNNEERGKPCLSPLELVKKIVGEALMRTTKLVEVTSHYPIQNLIRNAKLQKDQSQKISIYFIIGFF